MVIIDPWSAAVRDNKAKEYLEAFDALRRVIPAGDTGPAIGIVAHTRKPHAGERARGRALLNLLAGSHVLGSVPRCVFVLQSASDQVTETRVVWTCCKNNDGELSPRSAWERADGRFEPVSDFDWQAFDFPRAGKETGITPALVAAVFQACPFQSRSGSTSVLPAIRSRRRTKPQIRMQKVAEIGNHSATFAKSIPSRGCRGPTAWQCRPNPSPLREHLIHLLHIIHLI